MGCLLGNAISTQIFVAQHFAIPYEHALLSPDIPALFNIMVSASQPLDLLFYAIAIYEGFKFSSR